MSVLWKQLLQFYDLIPDRFLFLLLIELTHRWVSECVGQTSFLEHGKLDKVCLDL